MIIGVEYPAHIRSRFLQRSTMDRFQKILVVDDGERKVDSSLSAELAELGFASVTTPYEATDEVLALMPSPSAIVLQLPRKTDARVRALFMDLADRLRSDAAVSGIPIIVVDPASAQLNGGFASALQAQVRPTAALCQPER